MIAVRGKYEIDMCSGAILPKLLLFSIPLVFSGVLQLFFNAADIIVVGRFAGDNSLAAVGSTSSLIGLLTNVFIGLSVGANVIVARFYGAGEEEDLSETVHTAMAIAAASGVFLTVAGVFFARDILVLMQTPPDVLDLATLYLVIYFLGMIPTMIYNFGSALLRAVGDTRRPLFFLIVGGVINVLLNLFFVISLKLDVAGVAIATVISQCASAALVVRCMMRDGGAIRLAPSKITINKSKFAAILRVGVPAGVQGALFSFSNVVIQSSINSFGAEIMAANAAAGNIELFIYFAMNAFYQANISFTSQNYGAGRLKRIYKVLVTAQACIFVVGASLSALAVVFGRELLGIYSASDAVIDAGMLRLKILCATYVLCGFMDGMVGTIRGLGYSVLPTVVTLIGACGLRIVWIATLFQIEAFHSVTTIYLSYPVSWIVTFSAHFFCFRWIMKKHILARKP